MTSESTSWNSKLVKDVIELRYGKGLKEGERRNGPYTVYGSNGIIGYHDQYLVEGPGIIIGRKGSVGTVSFSRENFWPIDTTYYIIFKNTEDYTFWFYFLKTLNLYQMNTHSAVPGLNRENVYNLRIEIPSYPEQKAISKILSDLDSKIELNQQMNKTLESIAQAIFKHWFIDFEFPDENGQPHKSSGGEMVDSEMGEIPKGWKTGSLDDIIVLKMGLSPRGETYNEIGQGLPLVNGAADFSEENIKPKKFTTQPTRTCKKGDLLFCIRGTIGNLIYADMEYCLGRGVAAITTKTDYYKEFAYYVLSFGLEKLIGIATGSVIRGLSKPDILQFPILLADISLLKTFHTLIEPIFLRREFLKKENYSLSLLRDSLLPILMSGKIRIPLEE